MCVYSFLSDESIHCTTPSCTATSNCNNTLQQHTATTHCNIKLQQHTTTAHCNNTLQQHTTTTHYNSTLQQHTTTAHYNTRFVYHCKWCVSDECVYVCLCVSSSVYLMSQHTTMHCNALQQHTATANLFFSAVVAYLMSVSMFVSVCLGVSI